MRGFLYEIVTNVEDRGSVNADNLWNYNVNGVDWFGDVSENEYAVIMASVKELFPEIKEEVINRESVLTIEFTDEMKMRYFSKQFAEFKELEKNIDLHTFACTSLYKLQMSIDDGYDDAVLADEVFTTLDDYIRNAETGVKYYFGNIVAMH